jgi:hypothetical protein
MGKVFEKLILRTLQKHTEEKLTKCFGFRADDSMMLQHISGGSRHPKFQQ